MHANDFMNCMIDITKCPLTLILTKTHNSVKHEVMKRQKGLFYMKHPNSGLGAFLDISVEIKTNKCDIDIMFTACMLNKWYWQVSETSLKGKLSRVSCSSLFVQFWRFPKVLGKPRNPRWRIQDGPHLVTMP